MLGGRLSDPLGIEGPPGESKGLGLLAMDTSLEQIKQLELRKGVLSLEQAPVHGYEIHMGISVGSALNRPLVELGKRRDGAISKDGQVAGTYLHGLFESTAACDALLRWAGLERHDSPDYAALREAGINRLADAVETHLDMASVFRLVGREDLG